MTNERKREPEGWRPTVEREPEFNAFVSTQDRTGEMENPAPVEDPEAEEGEAVEDNRVVRETTRTTAPIAPTKPAIR